MRRHPPVSMQVISISRIRQGGRRHIISVEQKRAFRKKRSLFNPFFTIRSIKYTPIIAKNEFLHSFYAFCTSMKCYVFCYSEYNAYTYHTVKGLSTSYFMPSARGIYYKFAGNSVVKKINLLVLRRFIINLRCKFQRFFCRRQRTVPHWS